MKKANKISYLLPILVLSLIFSSFSINGKIGNATEIATYFNVEGRWKYKVQNVDPQYQEGILYIAKESGVYSVNIIVNGGGSMPAEEVEVNNNEVKFVVYVEEDRVPIKLVVEGDSFTGTGSSSQGSFTLTGERTPDPQ